LLESALFSNNGEVSPLFSCELKDSNPPLQWRRVPEGATSLLRIVDHPGVPYPGSPTTTRVHRVPCVIAADTGGLPEGVVKELTPGACKKA